MMAKQKQKENTHTNKEKKETTTKANLTQNRRQSWGKRHSRVQDSASEVPPRQQ